MKKYASTKTSQIKNAVIDHIEKVTRFDGSVLSEIDSEKAISLPLELILIQEVTFTTDVNEGPSKLPIATEKVQDKATFQIELQRRLQKAKEEAPKALQAWANSTRRGYRKLIDRKSAFLENLPAVGYEHLCESCRGAGKLLCGTCTGSGRTSCHNCYGTGLINCSLCSGTKRIHCYTCGGTGRWSEQVPESTWDHQFKQYVTTYRTVYHSCSSCYGKGHQDCYSCGPDGKIYCRTCGGDGELSCSNCGASGRVNCEHCGTSGIRHVVGIILAEVNNHEKLHISTEDPQLIKLIRSKLSRPSLPDYGGIDEVCHNISGNTIETIHRLHLDIRQALLSAGEATFQLYGFGPKVEVLNFENIAGHLLSDDLDRLENSVAPVFQWRRVKKKGELFEALDNFLKSELNLLLAEKVTQNDGSLDDASKAVQRHFGELIDAKYVTRATIALRTAIARIYASELLEPAVSLCALGALFSGIFLWLGWFQPNIFSAALLGFSISALIWFIFEWVTRRRIARQFEDNIGRRILDQLKNHGSIKKWRIMMVAAIFVTNLAGALVANIFPPVQARHQHLLTQADNDQILHLWFSHNSDSDLHLHKYPPHAYLLSKAESGNQQALIVLAWQLLLGAGDISKNANEAKRWLENASETTRQASLWKVAWAVQTINRDAMPDEIKRAIEYLKKASGIEEVEARYWLARIYLAEQSPFYDARLGINLLTRAADQRHAHAALLLGQKYAKGEGVPKNVGVARGYLLSAAKSGLSEAKNALNRLP